MAILSFSSSVVIVALIVGVASDELLPFAKAAKEKIPKDVFDKVYDTHFTGDDDIKSAVENAVEDFGEQVDIKIPDKITKALQEGALKIKDKLTPELFFELYANAADQLLRKDGLLKDDNVNKLAKMYADNLIEASKDVEDKDLSDTLPAVAGAIGKFLRQLGIEGKENEAKIYPYFEFIVQQFQKILKS